MRFCKMNGAGNDYVFMYQPEECVYNPNALSKLISDRHYSVGSDGLVLIDKSDIADFKMRIFNSDGSEAGMCGNAIRCVGRYVYDKGLTDKTELKIETLSGVREVSLKVSNGRVISVLVNMGSPSLIKINGKRAVNYDVMTSYGYITVTPVDIGNPHAVAFFDRIDERALKIIAEISRSPAFPGGVNAEAVRIIDRDNIEMRVYERGSGETLACGTGASAALFAAFLKGYVNDSVTVKLKGGKLKISYLSGKIYMEGDAEYNFEGTLEI